MENSVFKNGKLQALLMGLLTVLLCLVLGDGFLGLVSYRDDPTMKILVVLPGMAVFTLGLFLPPWLFRKRVHKRDTFLNIPLYAVSFFLLRGLFEERVFLTQHFFLRKHLPGFFSIPGEQFLPPLLLVGILWGVQWFFLDGFSNVPESKDQEKMPNIPSPERLPEKKIEVRNTIILLALSLVLFCGFLFFPAALYARDKLHEKYALDHEFTVQFDQDGMAAYYFNSGYVLGKDYFAVDLKYLSYFPDDLSGDVLIGLEIQEEEDGPYIPYHHSYGDNFYAKPELLSPGSYGYFHLAYKYRGEPKNYRFVIQTNDPGIEEATFYIFGRMNGFFK